MPGHAVAALARLVSVGMDSDQAFMLGYGVVGALLIAMSLSHAYLARLPLSAAMLYLLVGMGMGPWGLDLVRLDPWADAHLLERLTELAVIVSLFIAGMKLDLPLPDRRWRLPWLLATVSMLITVAAVAAVGVGLLHLPLGVAVLLGAVLAPTDPVLASDVQVGDSGDRDRLRFGLTGEGGLNDGTAFPLVMLGLGWLDLHDLGAGGWRWWLIDVVWAVLGGLLIGWLLGRGVGRAVLHLRKAHREAWGADEFIALGLIALAYGTAPMCHAYGFLAVFAAGLALGQMDRQERLARLGLPPEPAEAHAAPAAPTDSPMAAVQRFNLQLERLAEVAVVLAVAVLLADTPLHPAAWWFVPLLFLVIRPVAVLAALSLIPSSPVRAPQKWLMAWFGIRGIGSVYYLMYAITHGVTPAQGQSLLALTLAVVLSSVVLHGISVTPLMNLYETRIRRTRRATGQPQIQKPKSKTPNRS